MLELVQNYYSTPLEIDMHNRFRQENLDLEKRFQVRNWATKINFSLLGLCICHSWFLYESGMGSGAVLSAFSFFVKLAEQLAENQFDHLEVRKWSAPLSRPNDLCSPFYFCKSKS